MPDAWNPEQYDRFRDERTQPFHDLVALVRPIAGGRAVDLGCGTGVLTRELHEATAAAATNGIDSSDAMLARAAEVTASGLTFQHGDIATYVTPPGVDLVFSNAALQWVPDHPAVLRRWTRALAPGAQLAVQVPANVDHASHRLSAALATEPPFVDAFPGGAPPDPVRSVLDPAAYAELLDELGFTEQHVRLQVYGHRLASTAEVVEWVKGTSLTRFSKLLPPPLFDEFVAEYRRRLLAELGDRQPYFYAFKRILLWGRR